VVYGFRQGPGDRGGAGFGFRGSSPPWPYVGRGRGGLPRCSYNLGRVGSAIPGATREQEISYLKAQSEELRQQLSNIEARIKELEGKGDK